jgi:hypothetical protein
VAKPVDARHLKCREETHEGSIPSPDTMAIKPKCDFCGKELKEFGALLFGPPTEKNVARKFHVCKQCYKKIIARR